VTVRPGATLATVRMCSAQAPFETAERGAAGPGSDVAWPTGAAGAVAHWLPHRHDRQLSRIRPAGSEVHIGRQQKRVGGTAALPDRPLHDETRCPRDDQAGSLPDPGLVDQQPSPSWPPGEFHEAQPGHGAAEARRWRPSPTYGHPTVAPTCRTRIDDTRSRSTRQRAGKSASGGLRDGG
jgi:hypothetical protein